MQSIIVTTIKEWHIQNYFKLKNKFKDRFRFYLITNKDELSFEKIAELNPKFIFFPHWSWKIPKEIHKNFNCIIFHITDLPYGRGGSPFQNLVLQKQYHTKITALKAEEKLDSGDIYYKEDFYIGIGSLEENMIKISELIFEKMIPYILFNKIDPKSQNGKATFFKRRTPKESNLKNIEKEDLTINEIYDFIRMLDGEGYPKAFLNLGNFKIEFNEAHLKSKKIVGRFEISKNE